MCLCIVCLSLCPHTDLEDADARLAAVRSTVDKELDAAIDR